MWASDTSRVSAAALNQQWLHALALQPSITRVRFVSWVQTAFDAIAVLLLGSFTFDHISDIGIFVPALLLFIGAIALLQVHIRSLINAKPIDYAEPVIALQKRIENIRSRESTVTRAIFMLCWLAWTPLLIVGANVIGFDAYRLGAPFLIANIAFGIAAGFLVGWLLHSNGKTRIAHALDGTIAREAREALAKISVFEHKVSE